MDGTATAPGPSDRSGIAHELRLRLLATTDLHAHLLPYNYYANRRDDRVGLARLAELIAQARAECPNTLLFDNGDTLQGAPLGDAAVSDLMPPDAPHPMIAAMNCLGYDAATLGNHDFDFGLPPLERAIAQARYPILLANVRRAGTGASFLPPHALLDRDVLAGDGSRHRLRIGVTGVTPPQVMQWARARLAGRLEVDPMLPAAAAAVAALRDAGADLVILLAHTGLGRPDGAGDGENVGHLLSALEGVDAVIAGHTHCLHPKAVSWRNGDGRAAIVQPGFFGSHLGQIDLHLGRDTAGRGALRVVDAVSRLRGLAEAGEDRHRRRRRPRHPPDLRRQIARGHRLTKAYTAQPLGRSAVPLETFFSLRAPCAATQLIADAQRAAVAAVIAARPDLAGLPLLSCTTPLKAGGRNGPDFYTDVPPGPLQLRHAADLYPYANGLSLLRATGAQIRDWLDRSASAFRRILPGRDGTDRPQPLLDHDFASYNFDRMDGLLYDIDVSAPARTNAEGDELHEGPGRIRNLRHADGRPLDPAEPVLVVTNSYRAAGGGHFPAAAACEIVHSTPTPVRESLVAHIAACNGDIAPRIRPTWRFAPLGGTDVVYETGPAAAGHAARARALGLRFDGVGGNGFARYLMKL